MLDKPVCTYPHNILYADIDVCVESMCISNVSNYIVEQLS